MFLEKLRSKACLSILLAALCAQQPVDDRPNLATSLMDRTFQREVRDYPGTVFVLFYETHSEVWRDYKVSWNMRKALYDVADSEYGKTINGLPLKFTLFDFLQYHYTGVSEDQGVATLRRNYGVTQLPTLVVYKAGKEVDRMTCTPVTDEEKDKLVEEMKEQWLPLFIYGEKNRTYMYENSCEIHKAKRKRYKAPR